MSQDYHISFNYEQGRTNWQSNWYTSEIFYDLATPTASNMLTMAGDVVDVSPLRALVHELIHVIDGTEDAVYVGLLGESELSEGDYDEDMMDFIGDVVRLENAIMNDLGGNFPAG